MNNHGLIQPFQKHTKILNLTIVLLHDKGNEYMTFSGYIIDMKNRSEKKYVIVKSETITQNVPLKMKAKRNSRATSNKTRRQKVNYQQKLYFCVPNEAS